MPAVFMPPPCRCSAPAPGSLPSTTPPPCASALSKASRQPAAATRPAAVLLCRPNNFAAPREPIRIRRHGLTGLSPQCLPEYSRDRSIRDAVRTLQVACDVIARPHGKARLAIPEDGRCGHWQGSPTGGGSCQSHVRSTPPPPVLRCRLRHSQESLPRGAGRRVAGLPAANRLQPSCSMSVMCRLAPMS